MRKHAKINPTRVPSLTTSAAVSAGRRRFPAWIEATDPVPPLVLDSRVVLPRIRAALPLRRVDSTPSRVKAPAFFKTKSLDARRVR